MARYVVYQGNKYDSKKMEKIKGLSQNQAAAIYAIAANNGNWVAARDEQFSIYENMYKKDSYTWSSSNPLDYETGETDYTQECVNYLYDKYHAITEIAKILNEFGFR